MLRLKSCKRKKYWVTVETDIILFCDIFDRIGDYARVGVLTLHSAVMFTVKYKVAFTKKH